MTEKEKMIRGKIYDPSDEELTKRRVLAHDLAREYNSLSETDPRRQEIAKQLVPHAKEGLDLVGPVYFDYGDNFYCGKDFFANFNLTVLDICPIIIGDNVFCGPNVTIVTPLHPMLSEERNKYMSERGLTDKEYGAPITIGDNCWISSDVTICSGAKIGSGCVIGAGSVVTGTIPDGYLAYGVPCKPIRKITKEDSIYMERKHLF